MARCLRCLAVLPILAAFTLVGSVTRVGVATLGCAAAAAPHHAALVVEHGNGAVIRECVAFAEDQITGEQVLQDAQQQHGGVPEYATADFGSNGKAVCQIDDEPTQYPPGCWTASSPYWAMFVSRGGGGWVTSSRGISSQTFADGDAEGFRYEGQSDQSTPPSPAGICPPPAPPATATPAATQPAATPSSGASTGGSRTPGPTSSGVSGGGSSPGPVALSPGPDAVAVVTPSAAVSPPPAPSVSASGSASSGAVALASPPHPASGSSSPAGALTAAALGGALAALLAVQAVRRRRRAAPPPP